MDDTVKRFELHYTPRDVEGMQFHLDLSHKLNEKERMTFALIPGINQVNMTPFHYCIQVGRLSPIKPIDFLYQLDTFLTAIGFVNAGRNPDEIIAFEKRMQYDANHGVVENFRAHSYNDPFADDEQVNHSFQKSLEGLQKDLDIAIRKEEYMKAAAIRDQIKLYRAKHKS